MPKIMILGSSRSVNTFHMLQLAFRDQMPGEAFAFGVMYHSGCSMSMHADFIRNDAPVYDYYFNDSGTWSITRGVTMDVGLKDQDWDVVFLQAGTGDLENRMNEPCRSYIKEYVDAQVACPHVFWWHSTWTNATDPELYSEAVKKRIDPWKVDQYAQLTDGIRAAKSFVFDDPMFAGHITSGTPMMYALKVLELPEKLLYRDHTHLSDFGCLLVAFAWYTQYTGKPVTQIHMDAIPAYLRHHTYLEENRVAADLPLTEQMKQYILLTAQYTLEHPWSVPMKESV